MKLDNKTVNIVAGVVFLWSAFKNVTGIISLIASNVFFYMNPVQLVMHLFEIVVLTIMGICALRQKKRGKVLNALGIVCIGYRIVNLFNALFYSINVRAIASLAILIAAFVLSLKASGGSVPDATDTVSEATQVQAQAKKQFTLYDEQLRDGILTQEEYDQIMNSKQ